MKRSRMFAIGFVGFMACGFAFPGAANGRTQYYTVFSEMYSGKRAAFQSIKCTVCHEKKGANKSTLNEYGAAVGKALGAKNVKDKDQIRKALEEAESKLPI